MKIKKIFIATAMVFLALSGTVSQVCAQGFEVPGDRNVSDILPAEIIKGPNYQIRERVVADGYMHHYAIDSDYGVFTVSGDYGLRKTLQEIKAISAIKEITKSEAYLSAVKEAAKKPVKFGRDLVTDPANTIVGVPKGVFSLIDNISKTVSEKQDPSEDALGKQALRLSAYKRALGYELGVDVYSSNKVLQEEMNRVGWAGLAGGLSVTAVTAPVQGTGMLVVKSMKLGKQLNEMIKQEPPARLRMINEKRLGSMGIATFLVKQFLDHPHFTPRHDTVIVECLKRLHPAGGRATFIQFILQANDEETANFFQNMAETMYGYHERISPITEMGIIGGVVVATAQNGSAIIPFPLDHGVWTKRGSEVLSFIVQSIRNRGWQGKIEFWVTGTLSSRAKKELAALGVYVAEDIDKKIEFIY